MVEAVAARKHAPRSMWHRIDFNGNNIAALTVGDAILSHGDLFSHTHELHEIFLVATGINDSMHLTAA